MQQTQDTAKGFWLAFFSYSLWGVFPLYFYWLKDVASLEVLVHRIIWSMVFLLILALFIKPKTTWRDLIKSKSSLLACIASASFLSINWLIYIWAVANQMAVEASMGYFINPLISVLLAVLLLNERMNKYQIIAIVLALLGVIYLIIKAGVVPWVAFALAFSFGFYGLVRKKYAVDAFAGLTLETMLVAPFAIAYFCYLIINDTTSLFTISWQIDALLLLAGLVTTLPLLLFLSSLPLLRLSTVGLIQYVAPTLQFLVAIYIIKEPFDIDKLIAFVFIWLGLLVFSFDVIRARRLKNKTLNK